MSFGRAVRILLVAIVFAIFAPTLSYAQTFKPIPNWQYQPLQEELYKSASDAGFKGGAVFDDASDARKKKKGTTEEGEARMIIAKACKNAGLRYCAYHFALTTAQDFPGSRPALWALQTLEETVIEGRIAERAIRRLVNAGSFREIPESLMPMASYYAALDNTDKKLFKWIAPQLKTLGDGNFWSTRWKMMIALEEVRRTKPEKGIARLESLLAKIPADSKPELASLRQQLTWQLARLKYEVGDFGAALEVYKSLPTASRDGGRVLLERAWTHYSRGEYAETLGLLHSMKAPAFAASVDPEQYLLEMLTLRKLCHFAQVQTPAAEFRARFDAAVEQIRKRKPLADNLEIARMTFLKSGYVPEVETVSMIRSERSRLSDVGMPKSLVNELKQAYDKAEAEFREDVELTIRKDLDREAERLLDLSDQVQLVDYLSGLDAYRIQQGFEKRDYSAETGAAQKNYETLFWPVVQNEYWHDELKNYRVLVNDNCSVGAGSAVPK